jgi:hypothetical protein
MDVRNKPFHYEPRVVSYVILLDDKWHYIQDNGVERYNSWCTFVIEYAFIGFCESMNGIQRWLN